MSIAKTTTPAWQSGLTAALLQDPKKTGVLSMLLLMLVIMCVRMMPSQTHPATASASMMTPSAAPVRIMIPSAAPKAGGASALLRAWLSAPIPQLARNDFRVKSEYYPGDPTKTVALPAANGFWKGVEKLLSVQADQKEKRDAVIAALKTQAATLRPTSTVMGASPRAMVNGTIVREGDRVGAFQVLKIEPHGIVVESDGIRLAIPMN
jgi:hypothetical protein